MGFLNRRKSIPELEEEKDRLTIEEEVVTKQAQIAEREAIIAQLKKQYGSSWTKVLGVNLSVDTETLRTFLRGAKQGIEAQGSSIGGRLREVTYGRPNRSGRAVF